MADVLTPTILPAGKRKPVVPNGVLGMLVFVIAESMFFAGLISAFMIVRASAKMGWPPPGSPRLPAEQTAINTTALLLSGALLAYAWRAWTRRAESARGPLLASLVLGYVFVVLQGAEWVALLKEGMTLTSSSQGSFFYLIVGMHGSHAILALGALTWAYVKLLQGKMDRGFFLTAMVFWFFVVGLWPFIYLRVYF
jgi:heme/copper-type cytochrome/quinol oxidase subunit 3